MLTVLVLSIVSFGFSPVRARSYRFWVTLTLLGVGGAPSRPPAEEEASGVPVAGPDASGALVGEEASSPPPLPLLPPLVVDPPVEPAPDGLPLNEVPLDELPLDEGDPVVASGPLEPDEQSRIATTPKTAKSAPPEAILIEVALPSCVSKGPSARA
jgi:hypothetical protein